MASPTEKQIKLAEDIAKVLGIEFPTTSKEFNKRTYYKFIDAYYKDFKKIVDDVNELCWEDEMAWFQMLNG